MIEMEGNCTGNHDPKLAHLIDKRQLHVYIGVLTQSIGHSTV